MNYPNYYQNQQPQVSFMSIRGKDIAINYPIAPNNTIIFKDETAPYIYVKSMGFSPLEKPMMEIYKKEDLMQEKAPEEKEDNSIIQKIQTDIEGILDDIEGIKQKLNNICRSLRYRGDASGIRKTNGE